MLLLLFSNYWGFFYLGFFLLFTLLLFCFFNVLFESLHFSFSKKHFFVSKISYPPGTTFRIYQDYRWNQAVRADYVAVSSKAEVVAPARYDDNDNNNNQN